MNIQHLKVINNNLKKNFKYKIIRNLNKELSKELHNYTYDINYIMLYDLLEVIYHFHYKKYDNFLEKIKTLQNKYIDFQCTERANMLNFFNNSFLQKKHIIKISTLLYIINLTSCVSLLKLNPKLSNIYNNHLNNFSEYIQYVNIIPEYYIEDILKCIENNKL